MWVPWGWAATQGRPYIAAHSQPAVYHSSPERVGRFLPEPLRYVHMNAHLSVRGFRL